MKRATREWVRKAEADFTASQRERKAGAHDLACFLAQQSIEKYIKGILDEHRVSFPKTHDLRYLARLALPMCHRLKPLVGQLRTLSRYAVKFRYPGAWATAKQSLAALAVMRQARAILRMALGL